MSLSSRSPLVTLSASFGKEALLACEDFRDALSSGTADKLYAAKECVFTVKRLSMSYQESQHLWYSNGATTSATAE